LRLFGSVGGCRRVCDLGSMKHDLTELKLHRVSRRFSGVRRLKG